MKTSWALWGAWRMRWPFETGASAESLHTFRRAQYKEQYIARAILLLVLHSSIITWKICVACVKRLCLARHLFSVTMLPPFSKAEIQSGERLPHCYLVKSVRTVRSGAIFVHAHRWYCYLPVRLHCKPLRREEICCFWSVAPLGQQGRLMPPQHTAENSQHIIEKNDIPSAVHISVFTIFLLFITLPSLTRAHSRRPTPIRTFPQESITHSGNDPTKLSM